MKKARWPNFEHGVSTKSTLIQQLLYSVTPIKVNALQGLLKKEFLPAMARCMIKKFILDLSPALDLKIATSTVLFPTMIRTNATIRKMIVSCLY